MDEVLALVLVERAVLGVGVQVRHTILMRPMEAPILAEVAVVLVVQVVQ